MPVARVSVGTFALVVALAAPGVAVDEKDHQHHHARPEKLGTITFPTSCAPASQAPFARGVALLALVLVRRGGEGVRRRGRRRSGLRDGPVGRGHEPVPPDLGRAHPGRDRPRARPRSRRRSPPARGPTARRPTSPPSSPSSRTRRPSITARARSRTRRRWSACTSSSRTTARPRSSIRWPCSGPRPRRQDLREPEEGGRDPQPGAAAAAGPSGRGPLPDPQLRLPAARVARPARRPQLLEDRGVVAPRAAHAVAHLRAAGALGRFDPRQRGLGGGRPRPRAEDRSRHERVRRAARPRLPRLRVPAAGARRRRRGRSWTGSRAVKALDNAQFAAAYALAAVPARYALERGPLGGRGRARGRARRGSRGTSSPSRRPSPTTRAPSAPPAAATSPRARAAVDAAGGAAQGGRGREDRLLAGPDRDPAPRGRGAGWPWPRGARTRRWRS